MSYYTFLRDIRVSFYFLNLLKFRTTDNYRYTKYDFSLISGNPKEKGTIQILSVQ